MSARARAARAVAALLAFGGTALPSATGAADALVLVGADTRGSAVVAEVIEGIERAVGAAEIVALAAEVADGRRAYAYADTAIVLGREAIVASAALELPAARAGGAFVGAAPEATAPMPLLSLEVAPATLFAELGKIAPRITRVRTVVTDATDDAYLVRAARAARAQGIALEVSRADGTREIARAWRELLAASDGASDAVWLLDDAELGERGGYRFLVERAWQRDLLLVTTLPAYARRGVALGFVPDLVAYGEALVEAAREHADAPVSRARARYLELENLYRVLNERTLRHVGARLPRDLDRGGRDDLVIR